MTGDRQLHAAAVPVARQPTPFPGLPTLADMRLSAVAEIARALSAPWTLDEVLELIMDRLTWALDAERSTLFLVDGEELVAVHAQGHTETDIRLQLGQGIAGWVALTGRPVNVKDAYADSRFDPSWDKLNHFRTGSMLCQPMHDRHDNLLAVAQVLNKRGGYFTVEDEGLLATVLSMAAISIVNARLADEMALKNEALQRARTDVADKAREIDSLYEFDRDAVRAPSLDAAIQAVLDRLLVAIEADVVELAIPAENGGYVLHRLAGMEEVETLPVQRPGLHKAPVEKRKTVEIGGLPAATVDALRREQELAFVPAQGVGVPLLRDDELVGALGVYWRAQPKAALDDDKVRFIELAGQQIGHTIGFRLAQSAVERQDRLAAIGGALAGVVHDFKTPMTIASGYSQLLKSETDAHERDRLADGVQEQLRRMNDMVREVLGFARGDVQILPRKTLVTDWCREIDAALHAVFAGSGVAVRVDCYERGAVRIDAGKLLRAVQNLARNSREAFRDQPEAERPREPKFALTACSVGDQLLLTAEDNGPGVPRAFEHRMFDAFATHGKRDGTGLGLAMVKQVAEAHGGSVQYRQTAGGGATFELRVPKDARGPTQPVPQPPANREGQQAGT